MCQLEFCCGFLLPIGSLSILHDRFAHPTHFFFWQNLKILIFWGYFVRAASLWKISEAHVISFEESARFRKASFVLEWKADGWTNWHFSIFLLPGFVVVERAWLNWFRIQLKARIFLLQGSWFRGIELECRPLIWKQGWVLITFIYKQTWLRQGVQTVWRQPRRRGLSCFRLKQQFYHIALEWTEGDKE